MNVEVKWIRRKRAELGSDYKLIQSENLGTHSRAVVHDPDCDRRILYQKFETKDEIET